jgi:myo-inositol-1(or 4)-monophosphatase
MKTTENDNGLAARLALAQTVAREAGRLAMAFYSDRDKLSVELKGPQDFVSEADRAVERLIVGRLSAAFPDDAFIAEEDQAIASAETSGAIWAIDPIDGTTNFLQGRDEWCVSIGLLYEAQPALGVIYHPPSDELYAAARGQDATRNSVPIHVSGRTSFSESTIALEYSARTPIAVLFSQLQSLAAQGGDCRRNGSAALSLAYVADGRFDGYVEYDVYLWDMLAGMVLIREAGGWTSDLVLGQDLRCGQPLVAGTPGLRKQLIQVLRRE